MLRELQGYFFNHTVKTTKTKTIAFFLQLLILMLAALAVCYVMND